MKKISLIFIILFAISINLIACEGKINLNNQVYEIDFLHTIEILDDTLIFRDYEKGVEDNDYIISSSQIKPVIKSKFTYFELENGENFLALMNEDLLVLYDAYDNHPKYYATSFNPEFSSFLSESDVTASSYLTEGSKRYVPGNLSNLNLTEPWVESVKGNGEKETISVYAIGKILYFFNGYVSYTKPELYESNSRIKKIKIKSEKNNFEDIIVLLDDTPNPQKIELPKRSEKIIIEILEVYPGSKFEDTCINGFTFRVF